MLLDLRRVRTLLRALTADQAPQNLTARTKDPVKPLWAKLRENLFAREKRHPLADFREKPIRYSPAQFL